LKRATKNVRVPQAKVKHAPDLATIGADRDDQRLQEAELSEKASDAKALDSRQKSPHGLCGRNSLVLSCIPKPVCMMSDKPEIIERVMDCESGTPISKDGWQRPSGTWVGENDQKKCDVYVLSHAYKSLLNFCNFIAIPINNYTQPYKLT